MSVLNSMPADKKGQAPLGEANLQENSTEGKRNFRRGRGVTSRPGEPLGSARPRNGEDPSPPTAPSLDDLLCSLPVASPFKTDLGRERFLASRRLDSVPTTVFGYQRQSILGRRATFATWNHQFQPLAFEPQTNSWKVEHSFNFEKPNGQPRHWTTNLWFSLDGMKALQELGEIARQTKVRHGQDYEDLLAPQRANERLAHGQFK